MVVAQKPVAPKKVHLTPTSRKADNPWYMCCDTRAVAAVVMHLHVTTTEWYVSCEEITTWIIDNNYEPLAFEAAADLLEAFGGRSQVEITESVEWCVNILCGSGVLVPELEEIEGATPLDVYQLDWFGYDELKKRYPSLLKEMMELVPEPA
jgi:hypothetical protein